MPEYPVYIDTRIEADNDQDAEAITRRLAERVLEHPATIEVEARIERIGQDDVSGTTAPTPTGTCVHCGGILYAGLTHICSTSGREA